MKQNNVSKKVSKYVASALKNVLRAEANSTSCVVFFQPKAPENLSEFKRMKQCKKAYRHW